MGFWSSVGSFFSGAARAVGSAVSSVGRAVFGAAKSIGSAIVNTTRSTVSFLAEKAKKWGSVLKGALSGGIDGYKKGGWLGGLPGRKSSGSCTTPRPMTHDQMRFAMTRANQGFSGASNQSAKTTRGS